MTETLRSQNITLDDKEARRLERASTDGKIPRFVFFILFRFIKEIHIDCFRLELSNIEQALMERYQASGSGGSGEKGCFLLVLKRVQIGCPLVNCPTQPTCISFLVLNNKSTMKI